MVSRVAPAKSLTAAAVFLSLLAAPIARAAEPPPPLFFPPAVAPDDLPVARQSRPLAAWSPVLGLAGRVELLPQGAAPALAPAVALGLFDYVELGAALPMRFSPSATGEPHTAASWHLWAKIAVPGARREPVGAGAGASVTFDVHAPGFVPRSDSIILSPGLVFDGRTRWGFLHAYHTRVDLGLDANARVAWTQVDAGAGISLPLARSLGLWLWAAADASFLPATLPKTLLELPLAAHVGLSERFDGGWYLSAGFGAEMSRGLGGEPGWVSILSLGWTPSRSAEGRAMAQSKEPDSPSAPDDCDVLLSGATSPRPERRLAGEIPPVPAGKPCLANAHAERYVDFFADADYSTSHRFDPKTGALSTFLQLRYRDGTKIDVDFREIGDEQPDAETFRRQVKSGHVGPGQRVFPERMNRRTTPRLWEAKRKAIALIEADNEGFFHLALAGVMLTLPIPVGGLRPAPGEGVGARRVPPQDAQPARRVEIGNRLQKENVATLGGSTSTRKSDAPTVTVSKSRHPESAGHIEDAQAAGQPKVLTINRAGAKKNRQAALQGTKPEKGKDRDEYPPAMFKEGGKGASVRHVDPADNRGAGSCIGAQCRKLKDGDQVTIEVVK